MIIALCAINVCLLAAVVVLVVTRPARQEAAIDRLMRPESLGMPEDPREEIAEEDLPELEDLPVPVPSRYKAKHGDDTPGNVPDAKPPQPESGAIYDSDPSESDLAKLGVDPADEALDRELFMTDVPRVDEEN